MKNDVISHPKNRNILSKGTHLGTVLYLCFC